MNEELFNQKMMDSHILLIHSGMNPESTNNAILRIMAWNKISEDLEINIYLSANSNNFTCIMALYDVLVSIKNPISVYCMGSVGGYAPVLLAAATKGRRYALKHTVISLDQPYGTVQSGPNQQTEVEIYANRVTHERNVYESILAESLNKPIDVIHKDTEDNRELKAQEALEYGLIDEILE